MPSTWPVSVLMITCLPKNCCGAIPPRVSTHKNPLLSMWRTISPISSIWAAISTLPFLFPFLYAMRFPITSSESSTSQSASSFLNRSATSSSNPEGPTASHSGPIRVRKSASICFLSSFIPSLLRFHSHFPVHHSTPDTKNQMLQNPFFLRFSGCCLRAASCSHASDG